MKINEICKKREISEFGQQTPILVPSFSSKGFSDIKEIHTNVKSLLDYSLISAYDLHHNIIEQEDIYDSSLLIIDSGGFERNQDAQLSELYGKRYIPNEWNKHLFEETVKEIIPLSNIVLVSYDSEEKRAFSDQINEAMDFFTHYPNFASDFLCKPTPGKEDFIEVDELVTLTTEMEQFSVIGFTEKELGDSILERCKSILQIRCSLDNSVGQGKPIHIFGCIDPMNVLAYFICGADIFDGLSWLRFTFADNTAYYRNSHSITHGTWYDNDVRVKAFSHLQNIRELTALNIRMNRFATYHDWDILDLGPGQLSQLKKLLSQVGVTF